MTIIHKPEETKSVGWGNIIFLEIASCFLEGKNISMGSVKN